MSTNTDTTLFNYLKTHWMNIFFYAVTDYATDVATGSILGSSMAGSYVNNGLNFAIKQAITDIPMKNLMNMGG